MAVITNLVSYWPCNEASGNLLDVHGSNTLTETSGTIDATTGKVGGARDFEVGDTEYFEIADNASLSPGDTTFTFAAWVQLESTGADRVVIGKYQTTSNQREYFLLYNNTSSRFEFRVTSTGASSPTGSVLANPLGAPTTGTWYYVVAGHDHVANQLFISVNAGTEDTTSYSAGVFNGTGAFHIGSLGTAGGAQHWDGLVDEVGYWAKRLSAAEIAWLYNGGTGRSYTELVLESLPKSLVWWNAYGQVA
jgi:hypothetical protein